jgi:hypothetical protein
MYHSITFGDKNTWDDWGLAPSSRPVFDPPTVKTKTIDIPGGNGVIDLTESLTGYPVYNNRSGSIEFIVVDQDREWYDIYSEIMNYLHGQMMKAILEDDRGYYYEGRFSVNSWKSNKDWSRITIDYDVNPYKWSVLSSLDDWLWDPFSFKDGVIPDNIFKNIKISQATAPYEFSGSLFGTAIISPTFIVSSAMGTGITLRFVNASMGINITKDFTDGSNQNSDILLNGGDIVIYANTKVPDDLYVECQDSSGNNITDSSGDALLGGTSTVSKYTGSLSISFRRGEL